MKVIGVVAMLAICVGAILYMASENNRKNREEEYRREQINRQQEQDEERAERLRQEDERIRKERMAALAKEDAVRLLQRYVSKEEESCKEIVEECKIKLEMVAVDQRSLSDELSALEKEEERKAADAKRRNVQRRDKIERVDAILVSPTLNRLAVTYLGEDLSAMRAKFRSHIGNLAKMSDEKTRRYRENREKYQRTIKDTDEKVSRLTDTATYRLAESRTRLNANVGALRNKVEQYRRDIARLERKERVTTLNMTDKKNLESWRQQLNIAEAQLTSAEATAELGAANKAHLDLTKAETEARRSADTALSVRMDDDNAVEQEANREIAIFNAVSQYEALSLDRIRDAMQHSQMLYSVRLRRAEKKLSYLRQSTTSLDILNAEEVERLRKKISNDISEKFSFDIED